MSHHTLSESLESLHCTKYQNQFHSVYKIEVTFTTTHLQRGSEDAVIFDDDDQT